MSAPGPGAGIPAPTGGITVEVLTAADAEDRQRRAAGALGEAGLGPGDRVAFALGSSADLLCAVLGALRTGIVPVLLNATLLRAERDALVADAEAGLTIADRASLAALSAGPPVDLAPWPLARPMHYTSGTTGRAKGVWTGVWDEATARAAFEDEADLWRFDPSDVHLVCSPMYHSVSVRFAGGTLLRGGTCVVLGRFDAAAARDALRGGAGAMPTTTFMAPTALARLLAPDAGSPDAGSPSAGSPSAGSPSAGSPERFDHLRLLVHAGSPCPPATKRAAMGRVGAGVLWEFYGSTEGQFTVCSPEEWLEHPGSVGRARPDRELAVDPDGTVWCTAPPFAHFEYWGDPEKTAAAWRGPAFTVGDLGRLDADGYLYLDGRRDDLIISGGVNVYPAEVEAVLAEAPDVAEAAVFGVPDNQWGERVCASVVPAAGHRVDLDALRSLTRERLAPYKRPKEIVVVDELPHTATGKLQRRVAAERFDRR